MATPSAIHNEPVSAANVDMKFEVIVIPVADVDRAKAFYTKLGWRLDADFSFDNGFRVVQFTPPGSGCSVQFGTKITTAAPGSAQGLYLIVSDVEAARKELVARGIEVGEVFHALKPGAQFRPESEGRASGPDPGHRSYFSFATFSDLDGNTWLFQEITTRLPRRGLGNLDVSALTELLVETEQHHGEYEPMAPKHHWSGWYAAYIVARQEGKTPEEAARLGKLHIEGTR
ncbi:MAG: glyoxalase [Acidobacteriaceae bacterium]|nr:glyoxalase [Acidobacteriaceae bacterium]